MISREKLEELIEKGESVYCKYPKSIKKIQLNKANCRISIFNSLVVAKDNKCNQYKLENLYVDKVDAEFDLEFKGIERIETLSLPSWEEMSESWYNEFKFVGGNGLAYSLVVVNGGDKCIIIRDNLYLDQRFYVDGTTKENYIKACKVAKKLFLGEEYSEK